MKVSNRNSTNKLLSNLVSNGYRCNWPLTCIGTNSESTLRFLCAIHAAGLADEVRSLKSHEVIQVQWKPAEIQFTFLIESSEFYANYKPSNYLLNFNIWSFIMFGVRARTVWSFDRLVRLDSGSGFRMDRRTILQHRDYKHKPGRLRHMNLPTRQCPFTYSSCLSCLSLRELCREERTKLTSKWKTQFGHPKTVMKADCFAKCLSTFKSLWMPGGCRRL